MCPTPSPPFYQPEDFWNTVTRALFYTSLSQCGPIKSEERLVVALDRFNTRAGKAFDKLPGRPRAHGRRVRAPAWRKPSLAVHGEPTQQVQQLLGVDGTVLY